MRLILLCILVNSCLSVSRPSNEAAAKASGKAKRKAVQDELARYGIGTDSLKHAIDSMKKLASEQASIERVRKPVSEEKMPALDILEKEDVEDSLEDLTPDEILALRLVAAGDTMALYGNHRSINRAAPLSEERQRQIGAAALRQCTIPQRPTEIDWGTETPIPFRYECPCQGEGEEGKGDHSKWLDETRPGNSCCCCNGEDPARMVQDPNPNHVDEDGNRMNPDNNVMMYPVHVPECREGEGANVDLGNAGCVDDGGTYQPGATMDNRGACGACGDLRAGTECDARPDCVVFGTECVDQESTTGSDETTEEDNSEDTTSTTEEDTDSTTEEETTPEPVFGFPAGDAGNEDCSAKWEELNKDAKSNHGALCYQQLGECPFIGSDTKTKKTKTDILNNLSCADEKHLECFEAAAFEYCNGEAANLGRISAFDYSFKVFSNDGEIHMAVLCRGFDKHLQDLAPQDGHSQDHVIDMCYDARPDVATGQSGQTGIIARSAVIKGAPPDVGYNWVSDLPAGDLSRSAKSAWEGNYPEYWAKGNTEDDETLFRWMFGNENGECISFARRGRCCISRSENEGAGFDEDQRIVRGQNDLYASSAGTPAPTTDPSDTTAAPTTAAPDGNGDEVANANTNWWRCDACYGSKKRNFIDSALYTSDASCRGECIKTGSGCKGYYWDANETMCTTYQEGLTCPLPTIDYSGKVHESRNSLLETAGDGNHEGGPCMVLPSVAIHMATLTAAPSSNGTDGTSGTSGTGGVDSGGTNTVGSTGGSTGSTGGSTSRHRQAASNPMVMDSVLTVCMPQKTPGQKLDDQIARGEKTMQPWNKVWRAEERVQASYECTEAMIRYGQKVITGVQNNGMDKTWGEVCDAALDAIREDFASRNILNKLSLPRPWWMCWPDNEKVYDVYYDPVNKRIFGGNGFKNDDTDFNNNLREKTSDTESFKLTAQHAQTLNKQEFKKQERVGLIVGGTCDTTTRARSTKPLVHPKVDHALGSCKMCKSQFIESCSNNGFSSKDCASEVNKDCAAAVVCGAQCLKAMVMKKADKNAAEVQAYGKPAKCACRSKNTPSGTLIDSSKLKSGNAARLTETDSVWCQGTDKKCYADGVCFDDETLCRL